MDDLVKRLNMVDATMNPMTLVIVAREAARRIYHLETEVRVTAGWDRAMQELADKQEQRIEQLEAALRDAYGDCLDAVNKIKTDALTDVAVHQRIAHTTTLTAKDFMIAMAEDIEREIKARAALGEKKDV